MDKIYDIMIIGGGAAGCSAALTALNRGKSVAIISNPLDTTALYKAEWVTNYAGVDGIGGAELAENMLSQALKAGAELLSGRALSVMPFGDSFGVAVGNDYYQALSLIVAAGITRERLYPGESEYLGRGVSYCATCDGMLYRGKTVALIGNSSEAAHDAAFLRSIGCNVLEFRENGRFEIKGGLKADTLVLAGQEHKVDCVFIIKDTVSVTKLVPGLEYADGGIVTGRDMSTAVPGVFAAGDCTGKPFQLAKAVGEGNVAALSACAFVDGKNVKA